MIRQPAEIQGDECIPMLRVVLVAALFAAMFATMALVFAP
jgi:hypothetical protein